METGKKYSGFTLNDVRDSKETGSQVHYFHHDKSGADLIFLKNSDENRAFGIGFNTPPEDSTGVAHIVEHCVLSGSRKFKTREPFMELYKSSMATFLNAMTYGDMTIYPVSSMNEEDFHNLMDVYLDAVLFPDIYKRKEIFMQEGWHYDIHNEEDPITYKGVVYNEMKGAYSAPETQVFSQALEKIMPGSSYDRESGGYPYDIPNLTMEKFLDFHSKYYHPSNSMIYLYGNVDIEKTLEFIDSEYLSSFDDTESRAFIEKSADYDRESFMEFSYNADDTADPEKNSYLTYTVNLGTYDNKNELFLSQLMAEILINSESSPLRQALLAKNFGEDIIGTSTNEYYLNLTIGAKNTSDKRLGEFKDAIESELRKMVDEGIDRDLLMASLNKFEMGMRESGGALKGIIYFIRTMSSWRYERDPMEALEFDEVFQYLRDELKNGIFEKFIEEKILGSKRKLLAVHRPSSDVFLKKDEEERERLSEYKKSLSPEKLKELIEENKVLSDFQIQEDSEEDKNTIPKLKIADIPAKVMDIYEEREEISGGILLKHPMVTSGINYISFVFSEDHLSRQELIYLTYLSEMLGITDTEKRKYSELNNEINKYTSGLRFRPAVYKDTKEKGKFTVRLQVSSSAIGENWKHILRLLTETIFSTEFEDKKRLREILNVIKSNMEMTFDQNGNGLVMGRVKSFFSPADEIGQLLGGITFYDHVNSLTSDFDNKADKFIEELKKVYGKVFLKENLVASFTSGEEEKNEITEAIKKFTETLNDKKYENSDTHTDLHPEREAITSGSNVQYVSTGFDLVEAGYKYSGELVVLSSLLSLDYYHNAIRARGGAYGAGINIEPTGETATYSYRDPNLEKTVDVYHSTGEFLRNGKFTEDDIRSYIVGSMKHFNPPFAPSDADGIMISRYLRKTSLSDIEERLRQALNSTRESMMGYADMMDDILNRNYLSVYGNREKIDSQKELFDTVRPLKKTDN